MIITKDTRRYFMPDRRRSLEEPGDLYEVVTMQAHKDGTVSLRLRHVAKVEQEVSTSNTEGTWTIDVLAMRRDEPIKGPADREAVEPVV